MERFDLPARYKEMRISIDDEENERSVVNLVSPRVSQMIRDVPADMLTMLPEELESLLAGQKFTVVDQRLRTAFWTEYARAQEVKLKHMKMEMVYQGICSEPYFYQKFIRDKVRVAYMLLPPVSYRTALESALMLWIDRMTEVLTHRSVEPKMIEVQRRIGEMIEKRLLGSIPQHVLNRNLNFNVSADSPNELKANTQPQSMDEVEARLKQLRAKASQLEHKFSAQSVREGQVIDAELSADVSETVEVEVKQEKGGEEDGTTRVSPVDLHDLADVSSGEVRNPEVTAGDASPANPEQVVSGATPQGEDKIEDEDVRDG